jgi:hypothetical protein
VPDGKTAGRMLFPFGTHELVSAPIRIDYRIGFGKKKKTSYCKDMLKSLKK